jgi:alpha-L-fucosidase
VNSNPTSAQRRWMELEYGLFIHFGPNTLASVPWGDGTFPTAKMDFSKIDTDQWIRVAQNAGMRYAVLTTKHHDGFCLWPTAHTEYCVRNTSGKPDIVRRFCDSCKRAGLRAGLYYSLWDRNCVCYEDSVAYASFMRNQLTELLTEYGEIVEIWFDGGWDKDHPTRQWPFDPAWEADPHSGYTPGVKWEWEQIYNHVHTIQPDCLVLNNSSSDRPGIPRYFPIDARTAEHLDFVWHSQLVKPTTRTDWIDHRGQAVYLPLEVVTTLNPGWFWIGEDYYIQPSAAAIADWRRRAHLLGGNLLLNLGPTSAGIIPDCMIEPLMEARRILSQDGKKD